MALQEPPGEPDGAVKCEHATCDADAFTKVKAVLSRGLETKQDRARPHYFAVSHINLPFIPFLNWSTLSGHCVIPTRLEFTTCIDDRAVFWLG